MTTSVSAAELADLFADLGLNTPTTTAPADPRCDVTDLLVSACAHCRPAPPAESSSARLGPWFAATYAGTCAGCGGQLERGDRIRADGDSGYLGGCCGNIGAAAPPVVDAQALIATAATMVAPAAGPIGAMPAAHSATLDALWNHPDTQAAIAAANPEPTGPPPSTVTVMRDVLTQLDASRPRSQQKRLGPSEIGTPCQRQLAMKLADLPRQPQPGVPWAPMQGTAVHALMEEALRFHNQQLGYDRWVIEERLHMDDEISGSGDAFDTDTGTVVDWKFVGTTALRDVRRKTVANEDLVKPDYRVQAHLYGLGHERAGRTVRYVRLVFLARSHDYNDSAEWTETYQPDIAIKALARYYETQDLIAALDLVANPAMWDLVPAKVGKACAWCPFRRPGGPADGTGCPGDTQSKIDRQLAGLIA